MTILEPDPASALVLADPFTGIKLMEDHMTAQTQESIHADQSIGLRPYTTAAAPVYILSLTVQQKRANHNEKDCRIRRLGRFMLNKY